MNQDLLKIREKHEYERVYKKHVSKWRVESNGSIVVVTYAPRLNILYLNVKAAAVYLLIDGIRSVKEILETLPNNSVSKEELNVEVIKTINYLKQQQTIYIEN